MFSCDVHKCGGSADFCALCTSPIDTHKQQIKDLCMEIIGLSYESKPDPVKILNRSMALANVNAAMAREWAAQIVEASIIPGHSVQEPSCREMAKKIREA